MELGTKGGPCSYDIWKVYTGIWQGIEKMKLEEKER
jgi:hypothetical protein